MRSHPVRSFMVAVVVLVCAVPLLAQIPLPPLPPLPPVPHLPRLLPLPPLPGLDIQMANVAPPRRHRERIPPSPSADHLWINGMWHWQVDHWIWIGGRWERPHRHDVRWVEARYVREGRYWRYEPGHWSHQQVREGDDYRRWHERHRGDRGRHHDHDRD